jgi:hypothetical protein
MKTLIPLRMGLRHAVAVVAVAVCGLVAAGTTPAADSLPVKVGARLDGLVSVNDGVAVVVCHVSVVGDVLGIPVVVQAGELAVYLAANPGDYAGACRSGSSSGGGAGGGSARDSDSPSTGGSFNGQTAMGSGLLASVGDGALVVVCASGDGQLFLTPQAAAALVAADTGATLGSCAARTTSSSGTGTGTGAAASGGGGAIFVGGRVSVPATGLSCGDRLLVTRVATTPKTVRKTQTVVTARFVIVNDKGLLVRGATVWMRSAPLGYVKASVKKKTAVDGRVGFQLWTTIKLPLRRGGRLVLFARATLEGTPLISCVTGRRLISVRVSTPTA